MNRSVQRGVFAVGSVLVIIVLTVLASVLTSGTQLIVKTTTSLLILEDT